MVLVRLDDGRIVEANESLAAMLQRSSEELVVEHSGRSPIPMTFAAQTHRAQLNSA